MYQLRKHELNAHIEQVDNFGTTNLGGSGVDEAQHGLQKISLEGQLDASALISLVKREHAFKVAALGSEDVLVALEISLITGHQRQIAVLPTLIHQVQHHALLLVDEVAANPHLHGVCLVRLLQLLLLLLHVRFESFHSLLSLLLALLLCCDLLLHHLTNRLLGRYRLLSSGWLPCKLLDWGLQPTLLLQPHAFLILASSFLSFLFLLALVLEVSTMSFTPCVVFINSFLKDFIFFFLNLIDHRHQFLKAQLYLCFV